MMGNNQMMGSGENMNSMMGSLNTMGKNLQDLMGQMNTMMENKSLMENPGIKKNLEQMKSHMGSAMKSMDGLSCSLRSLW